MKRCILCFLFFLPVVLWAEGSEHRQVFFFNIEKLEFDGAKRIALEEKDPRMRFEMLQLVDILFYEGQFVKTNFKLTEERQNNSKVSELVWLQTLNAGYVSLFYDGVKSEAYKKFYKAYQMAQDLQNPSLIKASLLAFFKYYNYELVYRSDSFEPHLQHFERLKENYYDEVWFTIYKLIFYSKHLNSQETDKEYYTLSKLLDEYEVQLGPESPVLAFVFYEKAIKYKIERDFDNCSNYFNKVIAQANGHPFLKHQRFISCLQLFDLEIQRKRFSRARSYYEMAKKEINLADTLRSNSDLNLYASFFYGAMRKYDSAYLFLKKAYIEDVELNYKENSIEVNRLNVELKTQEKENANLRLRQNRIWLTAGLVSVALLFLASYFAYTNQLSKNKVQVKEKEVQAMKLEKILKDQEIFGIDAMIEGQEKERQRIAGDLHDNLGSLLATVKLHFQNIKARKDRTESEQNALLQKTDNLLDEAYQKVRGMAHAGNAGVNALEGLLPAVRNFASKVSIINKLVIEVEEHGMDKRLDNSLEISVFRIIQELITNIIKHANATEAVIHLTQHEDAINLMVEDNGNGFDISTVKPSGGMGLHSIQKKIENLGGRVTIDSIAQKGTTVIIDIPLT